MEIKKDLSKNGKIVTYNKLNGITRYIEFKARYSKLLFDAVDELLGEYYGLSKKELNYVLNYDIEFRTD